MKQAKTMNVVRQFKIESPELARIVTERYERRSAIITNKNGSSVEVSPNHLTKSLKDFLEGTGNKVEFRTNEARRGRRELAGVKVKVLPIKYTNYSDGAFIRIPEDDELSSGNANIVKEFLLKKGIDMARECQLVDYHTQEGSCITLFTKRGRK